MRKGYLLKLNPIRVLHSDFAPKESQATLERKGSCQLWLHIYDFAEPAIDYYIKGDDWIKRTAAVFGAKNGYLMVYENRFTSPDSRQHIYAARYMRRGISLPILIIQVEIYDIPVRKISEIYTLKVKKNRIIEAGDH